MLHLDGTIGEGGGQLLAAGLALSLATGTGFRLDKIRVARPQPGLLRRHLSLIHAVAMVSAASVDGAELASHRLTFKPAKLVAGNYQFVLGTAASVSPILQTLLPALFSAEKPSTLTLTGGTHVPRSATFDFLDKSYLPALAKMNARATVCLERAGFAPAGGGRVVAEVVPSILSPLRLTERGEIVTRLAVVTTAGLPDDIARRELPPLQRLLGLPEQFVRHDRLPDDQGPGNAVRIELHAEHATEVFTAIGDKETSAGAVVHNAVEQARRFQLALVPVGRYLAEQLLVPMALAGGGVIHTVKPTPHTLATIELIRQFLPVRIAVQKLETGNARISVDPP